MQNLLGEYTKWLQSKRDQEGQFYKQSFEKKWTSFVNPSDQVELDAIGVLERKSEVSRRVIEDFSAAAASKLFEREIREVVRFSANVNWFMPSAGVWTTLPILHEFKVSYPTLHDFRLYPFLCFIPLPHSSKHPTSPKKKKKKRKSPSYSNSVLASVEN